MGNKVRYKVVDNKRLNVYLTKSDLQKENVTIEDIVVGNEKSVVKIKKIFKVVSRLAHFNPSNRLLNIVLMPIVDGDLIISAGFSEGEKYVTQKEMFEFENFEDLLNACFVVKDANILSSLYVMDEKYYLAVELKSRFEDFSAVLSEFGKKTSNNVLFVAEHGKNIIKEFAVEKLVKLFN